MRRVGKLGKKFRYIRQNRQIGEKPLNIAIMQLLDFNSKYPNIQHVSIPTSYLPRRINYTFCFQLQWLLYNSSRTVLISILHGKTDTCGSESHKKSAMVLEGLNLTQESGAVYLFRQLPVIAAIPPMFQEPFT